MTSLGQAKKKPDRLSVSFHQTFVPERQYISTFLRFVASDRTGSDQYISDQTGIPVGKSSGKVPAIISYCSGMGLIEITNPGKPSERSFNLTDFGRVVFLEDNNLSEELTQWLAHLHLCREVQGAEVWYLSFTKGIDVLGMNFSESDLVDFLERSCGKRSKSPIGPMLRTYTEPAAFQTAQAITYNSDNEILVRSPAPLLTSYRNGYSAFFLQLWETYFSKERQITLSDFEETTQWQKMCGWNTRQLETVLEMMQETDSILIDKLMKPWVLTRKGISKNYWSSLYDELA